MKKWLLALLALGLALRLAGIHFGLPATLHPDEPHHINTAVYFGSGDLNPHVFKYPTLWMYLLFALYGVYFVLWSGFGLLHGAADFATQFILDPSAFYLIARGATAVCGALAAYPVWRAAQIIGLSASASLAGAAMIALSPFLVNASHYAKPDMLMLMFSSFTWLAFLRKNFILGGICLGMALTSQYTAAFLIPLLFLSHKNFWKERGIWAAGAAAVFTFFLGTPFALLDWSTFTKDIADILNTQGGAALGETQRVSWRILPFLRLGLAWDPVLNTEHSLSFGQYLNAINFKAALALILEFALILTGIYACWRKDRRLALILLIPIAAAELFLSQLSKHALAPRYIASLLPALALLTGFSLDAKKPLKYLARGILIILIPYALYGNIRMLRPFFYPDTRNLAKEWVEKNIPAGSVILMDAVHAGPAIHITQAQAERLYEKTSAIAHPRAKYYSYLKNGHPGGGYEILRLRRTSAELASMERHVEWSQQGYELADAEAGIAALKKEGVEYILWSSLGATPENSPRLNKFFRELEDKTKLIQEFGPSESVTGPVLKIYQLP